MQVFLKNEKALRNWAKKFSYVLSAPSVIFLKGDLGAGKTTWVRAFLKGLGYVHSIKSPTYTLVEIYDIDQQTIYHFDLYRLQNSQELEDIGIRDFFREPAIFLVEWPEKATEAFPIPDFIIDIAIVAGSREITVQAGNPKGKAILDSLLF